MVTYVFSTKITFLAKTIDERLRSTTEYLYSNYNKNLKPVAVEKVA